MACPAAKSAVVIPAVRKGLCNQRVRMVQDIMLAHLFGVPAGMKSATLRQACSLPAHIYTAAQIQDNADSRGFAHFQAGGGNQSLSPARSGRKSRLLLVHNGHTIEHKRDVSTEERFMADKFARFNLDWKALRNLKAGHQWCEYLSFGLDNGKLLSKVKSLLEG